MLRTGNKGLAAKESWVRSENNNSTKNCLVFQQVMTVGCRQNCPILEPLIDGFLLTPYPLLYFGGVWICLQNTWAFDVGRGGALVAPIRLTPLSRLQHRHQRVPENCQVIPIPRGIRPTTPANISCQDAQPHLITKTTLLELVGPKRLRVAHHDPEIGSVN